jgi:hypothetical protein
MKQVIDLLGKNVQFSHTIKVDEKPYSTSVRGIVTNVVLSLDGGHEVSVDEGDFFIFSELVDFKVLEAK